MPIRNFYEDCNKEGLEKVGLKKTHNLGTSRVLNFFLSYHINEKTTEIINIKNPIFWKTRKTAETAAKPRPPAYEPLL